MKILLILTILTLATFGCTNKQTLKAEKPTLIVNQEKVDTIFSPVNDYPTIKDTVKFISELRRIFELEVDESSYQKEYEKITFFEKVKIYGSDNDYIFIEYDYGNGCGAAFPWKYQLILTTEGKLVKTLSGQRYEFVKIFDNEHPFLLTVIATDKGNGWHEVYKISTDSLEKVFDSYFDFNLRTYDAHQDYSVNEPNELTLKIKDFNNDGFNDIAFVGKIVLIQGQTKDGNWYHSETLNGKEIIYSVDNPFKKIPVEFIFLYDKQTGHFKAKENYIEKYELQN